MLNFGVDRLVLVKPCAHLNDEARTRAVHAQRVLEDARVVDSLEDAMEGFDHLAAFAARVSARDRSHLRTPISLPDFAPTLAGLRMESHVGLVFGPEDDGLSNDEVELCDTVVTIPTGPEYRSMNLSHAVTVALYAVATAVPAPPESKPASTRDKELLYGKLEQIMTQLEYPEHRVTVTGQAFRRVIGRAVLSRWEYHRIMGVFTRTSKFLERTPPFWAAENAGVDAEDDADGSPGPKDASR